MRKRRGDKVIYYCSYYDTEDNIGQQREYYLSATNKMDYIVQALFHNGYQVEIVSMSGTTGDKVCCGKKYKSRAGIDIKLFTVFPKKSKIMMAISHIYSSIQMFLYLLFKLRKEDILLVYHSLLYMKLIKLIKKLKKNKFILEVEEIYGDVLNDDSIVEQELDFFRIADAYIFPTNLLSEKINKSNKPSVIVHGTYTVDKKRKSIFSDDLIHVVYAGTLDPRKGGALAAISAAEFLDERYHIHILGFGEEKDKRELLQSIDQLNGITKCSLSYDGVLSGERYIEFLHSCHIGLSTQNPTDRFNTTSFPSKVLSYLANGLRVISGRIEVLVCSEVDDLITYYDYQSGQSIAAAIISIDCSGYYSGRERIKELDKLFVLNIKLLLEATI